MMAFLGRYGTNMAPKVSQKILAVLLFKGSLFSMLPTLLLIVKTVDLGGVLLNIKNSTLVKRWLNNAKS
jgi:hypothetical protein